MLSLLVTRAGGGGGCFSVLCARGGGGGCFFLSCAHMGVPRSWHPIFLAFLRCAHMGVPRSWHPIFALLAHVLEATTVHVGMGHL